MYLLHIFYGFQMLEVIWCISQDGLADDTETTCLYLSDLRQQKIYFLLMFHCESTEGLFTQADRAATIKN